MATTVPTSLTVINETDVRGKALLALITQYMGVAGYYGFRSIGAQQNPVSFPCVMIDPIKQDLKMERLGKYTLKISYSIYFYCQESSPDAIVTQATDIGEIMAKLFSNNALGDLQNTNPPSNKFKTYPTFWLNSEMSEITWSTSFLNATPDQQQVYMRAGLIRFDIEDVVIK